MKPIKSEAELSKRLSDYLLRRIADAGVSYGELAERLAEQGFPNETSESIRGKLKRGKLESGRFPATFFVGVIAALGLSRIDLRDL